MQQLSRNSGEVLAGVLAQVLAKMGVLAQVLAGSALCEHTQTTQPTSTRASTPASTPIFPAPVPAFLPALFQNSRFGVLCQVARISILWVKRSGGFTKTPLQRRPCTFFGVKLRLI